MIGCKKGYNAGQSKVGWRVEVPILVFHHEISAYLCLRGFEYCVHAYCAIGVNMLMLINVISYVNEKLV